MSLPTASSLPNRPLKVAVLGATGAVGQELLTLLAERQFPVAELVLLASPRSAGQSLTWNGRSWPIQAVSAEAFAGVDLVLASAGGSVSKQWAPVAAAAGALVIDNSSAFRLDPQVPLVVPEVNPQAAFAHQGIIANPNCTTILMTLALAPLAARRPLRRVVVSTYQSASGAGARAMEELRSLSQTVLDGGRPRKRRAALFARLQPLPAQLAPAGQRLLRRGAENAPRNPQDHGIARAAPFGHLRAGAGAAGPLGGREH